MGRGRGMGMDLRYLVERERERERNCHSLALVGERYIKNTYIRYPPYISH